MRLRWLVLAFGLFACGSENAAAPQADAGPKVADAGDAGDVKDEGPIPPAPTEPGCAMTIDGEPLQPSGHGAELTSYPGQPTLTLLCAGVAIDITRPGEPGVYEATARFGKPGGVDYQGPCTTRLDRIAIVSRGGLAARVRCDVPLVRALVGGNPKPSVRIAGYVVLPPAGPLPPADTGGPGPDRCTFSVSGEYTRDGSGTATSERCGDRTFTLATDIPSAWIYGSFCPTCRTLYDEGRCTRTNVVLHEGASEYDVACDLGSRLSGRLEVKAHIHGAHFLPP